MNKLSKKLTILLICAALSVSSLGVAFAVSNDKTNSVSTSVTEEVKSSEKEEKKEISKDETVYVLANADGSVKKIIVSDWIKNAIGASALNDNTELQNIENVKGDESYSISGDAKVWDAQGNDIYYKGNISKELPVGLTVSYKLDGKSISAKEIAGKSGKVTIRFDYDNRQYETVKINGKEEKIYVPFAMLTGMLLDSDSFRNVEVSNGKLINDGNHTAVIGFALPGLQENLGIGKDKLDIPDYVEITADVKDFSFGMTVTVATNELLNELDTSKLDSANGLTDSIDELSDGMKKLLDGSSALYDGISTLLEKSGELVSGINQLADGAKILYDGTTELDNGAEKIKAGTAELSAGLDTLKGNNDALNGGAKQVFETLLSTATTQIKASGIDIPALTIDNYSDVLDNVVNNLDDKTVYALALKQVTDAVEANRPLIISKVTEAVRAEVESKVTAAVSAQVKEKVTESVKAQVSEQVIKTAAGMSKSDYDNAVKAGFIPSDTQKAINAAIENQMNTDNVKALIESNTKAQMATAEIKATIKANTDAQMNAADVKKIIADNTEAQVKKAIDDNMTSPEVQEKLKSAKEGRATISALKTSLNDYNTFYKGLYAYTDGVASAASGASALSSGAKDLKDGTAKLSGGAKQLYDGLLTVKNGLPALIEGENALRDGAMQLSDGLKEFNDKGISKIVDIINGDAENLIERVKATVNVSKNYRNFAGLGDDMDGNVKFIYRTEEID